MLMEASNSIRNSGIYRDSITAASLQDRDKARSGDAHACIEQLTGFHLATVADGVGTAPCGWLASSTTCQLAGVCAQAKRAEEENAEQLLAELAYQYEGRNRDDATLVIIRREMERMSK